MIDILTFAVSGFWNFLVCFIYLYAILQAIILMFSRFMRMLMVRKHGWPPPHLDADGDFQETEKE